MDGIIKTRIWLVVITTLAALLLAQAAMAGVSISIGGSWGNYNRGGSSVIIGVGPGGYYGYPRGYVYPYCSHYRFYYGSPSYPGYYGRAYPYYGPYYDPYRHYPDWPDPRYQQPYKGYQLPRR